MSLREGLLRRLPSYYQSIREFYRLNRNRAVSSGYLAEVTGMDDTQVRKDLAAIGVKGRPRVGFDCAEVLRAIREVLGLDDEKDGVIVGVGRLGGALASYQGFSGYGLNLVALFDVDSARVGTVVGGLRVEHVDLLENVVRRKKPELAILTCNASAAQGVAERLVAEGVLAIWNFAPTILTLPETVAVRNEHLSTGFAELSYRLREARNRDS